MKFRCGVPKCVPLWNPGLHPLSTGSGVETFNSRICRSCRPRRWGQASLPGLRRIARRNARDLFRINAGFLYSQVLFAAVESGLLTRLRDGGRNADALAAACGLPPAPMERLLIAAQGLKLVTRLGDGTWWLDDLGAVVAGNPGIAAMIRQRSIPRVWNRQ